jgi:hypothetical protein
MFTAAVVPMAVVVLVMPWHVMSPDVVIGNVAH